MKRKKKANRQGSVTKTKKNKPYWVRVTDPATGNENRLECMRQGQRHRKY